MSIRNKSMHAEHKIQQTLELPPTFYRFSASEVFEHAVGGASRIAVDATQLASDTKQPDRSYAGLAVARYILD